MKFLVLIFLLLPLIALGKENYIVYNDDKGKLIIDGLTDFEDWKKETEWDFDNTGVIFSKDTINLLKSKFSDTKLILVGGSWCGDTRSEFPKIYRLIKEMDALRHVTVFGVDRTKLIKHVDFQNLIINKVPTLIVMQGGIEKGRIEEFPESGWEHDLLIILGD